MEKNILVAAAWPYVNGSLHLGHVAGLLPADILARYHRSKGDKVLYVSGSDCHGTPILVTAEKEGKNPADIASRYHDEFVEMLIKKLGFSYSLYTKTMGDFHKAEAQKIFSTIYEAGYMTPHEEQQAFCSQCQRSLPDRYIEGRCPNCGAENARGDQCDSCGHVHDPSSLINPRCRNCGTNPIWQSSTHLYFNLPVFEEKLKNWVKQQKGWRNNAFTMTEGWFQRGLQERPITRDLIWGIPVTVPGYTDKCIYVWFEAVMGYLTCSKEWAAQQGTPDAWREWWENDDAFHYYVHGKDNIPFHTILWPAMLMALRLHLPDQIVSSEYLRLEGLKLSKSKGIAVWLPHALEKFESDAIRFYLTLNGPESGDISFNWRDFQHRVNGDLVGNLGNFWNRTFSMANRYFGKVPESSDFDEVSAKLLEDANIIFTAVGDHIERAEFRQALRLVLEFSQRGNGYINEREPWKQIKDNEKHAQQTIYVCCQIAETLRRLSAPFIPHACEKISRFLKTDDLAWRFTLLPANYAIEKPTAAIAKIDAAIIDEELSNLEEAKKQ
ncbi:methionine--tRNA ligase [Candidatus Falkowbacteria bacterium]|nr:methionine--tRNA ligase [Candidatus Falkowbacteria bacterium]